MQLKTEDDLAREGEQSKQSSECRIRRCDYDCHPNGSVNKRAIATPLDLLTFCISSISIVVGGIGNQEHHAGFVMNASAKSESAVRSADPI